MHATIKSQPKTLPVVQQVINSQHVSHFDSDTAENPAIREHLRQKLAYLCLHGFSGPFSQQRQV